MDGLDTSFRDGLRGVLERSQQVPVVWGLDGESGGPLRIQEPSGEDLRLLMRINLYINEKLSGHGVTMNWTSILLKQGSSQVWQYRCPGRAVVLAVDVGSEAQVEVGTVSGSSVAALSAGSSLILLEPAVPFRLRGLARQCVVVMGYQDASRGSMTKAMTARIKSTGFNWKVPLGWCAPVRGRPDRAALKTGRALYVRGSQQEGKPSVF